jgi:dihydropteroate synthase type 2
MDRKPPSFVGIVNLTTDSFSDGGRFLDHREAIKKGEELLRDGADWLDLGAESSNPEGAEVSTEEQIRRLEPVFCHFVAKGQRISIDTHRPRVMETFLDLGVGMINDVTGVADPEARKVLARFDVPVVVMHARNFGARAEKTAAPHVGIIDEIAGFFRTRAAELAAAGIAGERLICDPGMGFFLGSNPEPSLAVLKGLAGLSGLGPLYVSCSRKSFIGNLIGRPPLGRGAGTLAAELWALRAGAAYVRTHDVRAIREAWRVWQAIEAI